MNKSVYLKTMKNLRKRVKIRSVNNAKDYKNGWVDQLFSHRIYLVEILLLVKK